MRVLSLLGVLVACAMAVVTLVSSEETSTTNRKSHRDVQSHEEKGYFLHLGKEALGEVKKKTEENSKGSLEKVPMFRFAQTRTKATTFAFAKATVLSHQGLNERSGSGLAKGGKKCGKGGKGGCAPTKPAPVPKPKPSIFPSDTACVMCEFALESVMKKLKSSPPQMQPASMVTDYSDSGAKNGDVGFRTYNSGPVSFLQTKESVAAQAGTIPGILPTDIERIRKEGEKSEEFENTYKTFMDALDDVCFHEMPASFHHMCKPMYDGGDTAVEMYLHGYEDWEICASLPKACKPDFFDSEGPTPYRL